MEGTSYLGGISNDQVAAIVIASLSFTLLIVRLLLFLISRSTDRESGLRRHYLRLGSVSPDQACPCGRARSYGVCCRGADIERLESDVIADVMKRWARKWYRGRRQNYTMAARLEDHPLPEVILPRWVTDPQEHGFPIPEETLIEWRPTLGRQRAKPVIVEHTIDVSDIGL